MIFGDLTKGDRFRIWREAGTGDNTGIPAKLSDEVYAKVSKKVCKRLSDGQWMDLSPAIRVQLEPPAAAGKGATS